MTAGGSLHALLWTGTAASAVDLNPSGFTDSVATGVAGGEQVGEGLTTDDVSHALLWTGTAASAVDLNAFLPSGFTNATATGIDESGDISGYDFGPNGVHAVLWQPVGGTSGPQMSFVASEMPAPSNVNSMPASQGATSIGAIAASIMGAPQTVADMLSGLTNPTPQSGGGGSPAMQTDPPSGSPNLLNLAQSSSTMNPVLMPPGS